MKEENYNGAEDRNKSFDEQINRVDTMKETDKKCPSCGGVMDFNPNTGGLKCPYCGTEEQIEVENTDFVAVELDFDSAEEDALCDWGTKTKTVICKSCGAETIYDVNQISNECPYCGSNQVMNEKDKDIMAPGGVVVFKLDSKIAGGKFKDWIKKKLFCPNLAKESAKPTAFKGVYVPYWTFDADTYSRYSGQYGIDRHYKDSEGKDHIEVIWHSTRGDFSYSVDDMLCCGSSIQNEKMLSGIEPFDTTQVVEYKPEYMAGFMAERYTVKMKSAWEIVKRKISGIISGKIDNKILRENNAQHTKNVDIDTEFSNITYKYILLPIWISSFKYKNKVYQFVVNGQTGKVSGESPISIPKVLLAIIIASAVIFAIYYLNKDSSNSAAIVNNVYSIIGKYIM